MKNERLLKSAFDGLLDSFFGLNGYDEKKYNYYKKTIRRLSKQKKGE